MQIPVQNIYYLLCYAWDKLDEKEKVAVSADDQTELLDLLAKVLINATRILLKRGIDRNYVEHVDELSGIKGKLNITESLQRNSFHRQKALCQFDEFSPNVLTNQILVTTLANLTKIKSLKTELKWEARQLLHMFPGIAPINIRFAHFRQIRLHRNNRFYDFVLKVCQIIYENILPGEDPGALLFMDFRRDENKMNRLFEEFIYQFYRREQKRFSVNRGHIDWQLEAIDPESAKYLPIMKTDITLQNNIEKIIIDAKFYKRTLTENYGQERIHSGNLYQLFSYLINQESEDPKTLSTKGILLYPTINREYDLRYSFKNHVLEIRTVNLHQHWTGIRARLLEISNRTKID